jgi:hypothetical protein
MIISGGKTMRNPLFIACVAVVFAAATTAVPQQPKKDPEVVKRETVKPAPATSRSAGVPATAPAKEPAKTTQTTAAKPASTSGATPAPQATKHQPTTANQSGDARGRERALEAQKHGQGQEHRGFATPPGLSKDKDKDKDKEKDKDKHKDHKTKKDVKVKTKNL